MPDEPVMSLVGVAHHDGVAHLTAHLAVVPDGACRDAIAEQRGLPTHVTGPNEARECVHRRPGADVNGA